MNEITIQITEGKVDVISNIEHDDLVMYFLIEAIYALRNKQYKEFQND